MTTNYLGGNTITEISEPRVESDAERLVSIRQHVAAVAGLLGREANIVQGHVTFLLRLIDERDAEIVKLQKERNKLEIALSDARAVRNVAIKQACLRTDASTKEQSHLRFYNAFHAWFMSEDNGCDFWSECDAPEALAIIATEIADQERVAAIREAEARAYERAAQVALGIADPNDEEETGFGKGRVAAYRDIRALIQQTPEPKA